MPAAIRHNSQTSRLSGPALATAFRLTLGLTLGLLLLFAASAATAPVKQAEAALLAGPPASVELDWRLYRPDFRAAPQRVLQKLNLAPDDLAAILLLTVSPPEGHYLYAPFAAGQSREERDSLRDLVRPLVLTLENDDGSALPGVRILYPPGTSKYDQYSETELPVYSEPITLLAIIPDLPQNPFLAAVENAVALKSAEPALPLAEKPELDAPSLRLSLDGLLCSPSACTPLKLKRKIAFTPQNIIHGQLPAEFNGNPDFYLPFPELTAESGAKRAAPDAPFTEGVQAAAGGGRDYADQLSPRYYQQGLEVAGLGRAILFGLLAGFILNFMPCVLPVVTLKLGMLAGLGGVLGLQGQSEAAKRTRARFRTYSLFFSLGVLTWFAALFAVLGFAGLIWGQFFQSQALLLALAMILFLLALSLFGVFRLPMLQFGGETPNRQPAGGAAPGLSRQAFTGGILATLLATPCSGPLLGGVLGWAVGQPLPFLAATLLSVGLGMAAPFLLICLNPALARFLPRPGGWSLVLEKIMGFLLLGTVIYLLSMLRADKLITVLIALLLLALAAWLRGRKSPQQIERERLDASPKKTRVTGYKSVFTNLLALGLTVFALYLAFWPQAEKTTLWRDFTPASFEAALGEKNLLLDFTADWCINCRAMEATTLSSERLKAWEREFALTYIKVDLTHSNPAGEELLTALGSASIPVLAIFPAGEGYRAPTVLRDLITPGQLEEALRDTLKK